MTFRLFSVMLNILLLSIIGLYFLWPRILAMYSLSDAVGCWTNKLEYGPYCVQTRDSPNHESDFMFTRLDGANNVYLTVENEEYSEFVKKQRQSLCERHVTRVHLVAKNISLTCFYDKNGICRYVSLSCNEKKVFLDANGDGIADSAASRDELFQEQQ